MKIGYLMQAGVPDVRQYPLSGPANHVKQIIDSLKDAGHQLRLIANFGGQIWKSDDLEVFEPVNANWHENFILPKFESVVRRVQFELKLLE